MAVKRKHGRWLSIFGEGEGFCLFVAIGRDVATLWEPRYSWRKILRAADA